MRRFGCRERVAGPLPSRPSRLPLLWPLPGIRSGSARGQLSAPPPLPATTASSARPEPPGASYPAPRWPCHREQPHNNDVLIRKQNRNAQCPGCPKRWCLAGQRCSPSQKGISCAKASEVGGSGQHCEGSALLMSTSPSQKSKRVLMPKT